MYVKEKTVLLKIRACHRNSELSFRRASLKFTSLSSFSAWKWPESAVKSAIILRAKLDTVLFSNWALDGAIFDEWYCKLSFISFTKSEDIWSSHSRFLHVLLCRIFNHPSSLNMINIVSIFSLQYLILFPIPFCETLSHDCGVQQTIHIHKPCHPIFLRNIILLVGSHKMESHRNPNPKSDEIPQTTVVQPLFSQGKYILLLLLLLLLWFS